MKTTKICRDALSIAVFVLLCCIAFATVGRVAARRQTAAAVPESAEGLKSQVAAILSAAKDHDSKQFDNLVSDLEIPKSAEWLGAAFGDDVGPKLVASYESSWASYKDTLAQVLQGATAAKPKKISVTPHAPSSSGSGLISAVQHNAKQPLILYTVSVTTSREGIYSIPGVYVYVNGAFRVVNWSTLYSLPNVKPVRIRIGGLVQQPKLRYGVSPKAPADVHGSGEVTLHVVIDIEGNVKQVDVLSGPPILGNAAIEAVKQWLYQPTLLNGDPVEVDTTVTVNFAPGG